MKSIQSTARDTFQVGLDCIALRGHASVRARPHALTFSSPARLVRCITLAMISAIFSATAIHAQPNSARLTTVADPDFPQAAALNFNSDHDRLLVRIQNSIRDGKTAEAIQLLKLLLASARDSMMSQRASMDTTFLSNNKYAQYRRFNHRVEQVLRESADLLAVYRVSVDPEVIGLLVGQRSRSRKNTPADGRRHVRELLRNASDQVLQRITDEYFLSSFGDDAAAILATRKFDRGAFTAAAALIRRLLDDYPQSNLPATRIKRLGALVEATIGNTTRANQLVQQLPKSSSAKVQAQVDRLLQSARDNRAWNRGTVFSSLPTLQRGVAVGPEWSRDTRLSSQWEFGSNTRPVPITSPYRFYSPTSIPKPKSGSVVDRWRKHRWRPTAEALFQGGHIYWKSNSALHCIDQLTGKSVGEGLTQRYAADPLTLSFVSRTPRGYDTPESADAVRQFGDRVDTAMSTSGDLVFVLSGRVTGYTPTINRFRLGVSVTRARPNQLVAYRRTDGLETVWKRPTQAETQSPPSFMATPIAHGSQLLVPAMHGDELWLYSLDATDGHTLWRTFLLDESRGFSHPWAPVGVSIADSDVYVATGNGVVFALEVASGTTRWATRYVRSPSRNVAVRSSRSTVSMHFDGWTADVVIPYGNWIVVVPSDRDYLFSLNRTDGTLSWDSPKTPEQPPTEYVLGLSGEHLYLAGPSVIRRYNIRTGKPVQRILHDECFGHGALCTNGIFLPLENEILQLDHTASDMPDVGRFKVVRQHDQPLGNLFAHDGKLFVSAMNRIELLADMNLQLQQLAKQFAAGNIDALVQRARLKFAVEDFDDGCADLALAHRKFAESGETRHATSVLVSAIQDFKLTTESPAFTLRQLVENETRRSSQAKDDADPEHLRLHALQVSESLQALDTDDPAKSHDMLRMIRDAAVLFDRRDRVLLAKSLIQRHSRLETLDELIELSKSPHANARLLAIAGLNEVREEKSDAALATLREDDEVEIKFESAVCLLNRGDRRSLDTLASLLNTLDPVKTYATYALRHATGQTHGVFIANTDAARQAAIQRWRDWIKNAGETAKLNLPVNPRRGTRTLLASPNGNSVFEVDLFGEIVWQKSVFSPTHAEGLENGSRLICAYYAGTVTEYDEQHRTVWEYKLLPERPYKAHRLQNGNTLIVIQDSHKIIEVNRAKQIVWSGKFERNPSDAALAANGDIWVALRNSNEVARFDRAGKKLAQFVVTDPRSVQVLPNGNILVCEIKHDRVVEYDPKQEKVVKTWTAGLRSPRFAERLTTGATLIVDGSTVREFSEDGKVVWSYGLGKSSVGTISRF
ncbi:MAG: PQQ-binding-like beta-propeller repeat protein [Planctomycetota bacterium]|nr:PQQ-binding-like beta-propeller repeat protein [Planctomycetota bacterium]